MTSRLLCSHMLLSGTGTGISPLLRSPGMERTSGTAFAEARPTTPTAADALQSVRSGAGYVTAQLLGAVLGSYIAVGCLPSTSHARNHHPMEAVIVPKSSLLIVSLMKPVLLVTMCTRLALSCRASWMGLGFRV